MGNKQDVIDHIRQAFSTNVSPGDPYLQPYPAGYDLGDEIKAFKGINHWEDTTPSLLDNNPDALNYFSDTGFRLFLPAYLIADLNDQLECVDPLFHLIYGFSEKHVNLNLGDQAVQKLIGMSEFINPIQYGAITWFDRYRYRLSMFPREEAQAIVNYLNFKKQDSRMMSYETDEIDAALDKFWLDRAENAPLRAGLEEHINQQKQFVEQSLQQFKNRSDDL